MKMNKYYTQSKLSLSTAQYENERALQAVHIIVEYCEEAFKTVQCTVDY